MQFIFVPFQKLPLVYMTQVQRIKIKTYSYESDSFIAQQMHV